MTESLAAMITRTLERPSAEDLGLVIAGGDAAVAPIIDVLATRHAVPMMTELLLLRVFDKGVLACPRTDLETILGIPSTGPPIAPARFAADPEFGGWQDDVPETQQALR